MKYAELHCHTIYSNSKTTECLTTPLQLIKEAKSKGLSAVAITDHDTMEGNKKARSLAKKYGITIIPAVEIDGDRRGQILAYGVTKPIKHSRSPIQIIKDVHAQGGVAIVPHPFDIARKMEDIGEVIKHADGIEIINYGAVFNTFSIWFAKKNNIKVQTVGSDAHHKSLIGTAVVGFPDSCKTWQDYVACLKKGKFDIRINRSYTSALAIGIGNIFYTRSVGFLWKVFPSKRLSLEINGIFYLLTFVIKAPFTVSFTATKIVYELSGLSWAVTKIIS